GAVPLGNVRSPGGPGPGDFRGLPFRTAGGGGRETGPRVRHRLARATHVPAPRPRQTLGAHSSVGAWVRGARLLAARSSHGAPRRLVCDHPIGILPWTPGGR